MVISKQQIIIILSDFTKIVNTYIKTKDTPKIFKRNLARNAYGRLPITN